MEIVNEKQKVADVATTFDFNIFCNKYCPVSA